MTLHNFTTKAQQDKLKIANNSYFPLSNFDSLNDTLHIRICKPLEDLKTVKIMELHEICSIVYDE
jgi:hypothetical protein